MSELTPSRRAENLRLREALPIDPLIAGLDLPGVGGNDPDPAKIWIKSLYIGRIDSKWISEEKRAAHAAYIVAAYNDLPLYEVRIVEIETALAEALAERAQMLEALRYVRSFGLHGDIEFTDVPEHRGCSVSFFVEQAIELGDKP